MDNAGNFYMFIGSIIGGAIIVLIGLKIYIHLKVKALESSDHGDRPTGANGGSDPGSTPPPNAL
mgnify:CR=1 FL=1